MKKFLCLIAAALLTVGIQAANEKVKADTLIVKPTPQMHCSSCETKIKKGIRFVKGVKKINTSLTQQTVTIIYQKDKATYDDFVKAFQGIGYEIKEVK